MSILAVEVEGWGSKLTDVVEFSVKVSWGSSSYVPNYQNVYQKFFSTHKLFANLQKIRQIPDCLKLRV